MNYLSLDPDVREQCRVCLGPVFHDEPRGHYCPDCRATLAQIHAAHHAPKPPHDPLGRAARALRVVGGGEL